MNRWGSSTKTIRQVLVGQFLLVVCFAAIFVALIVVFWRLPLVQAQNEADQTRAVGIAAYHVDVSLRYAEQLAQALARSVDLAARGPEASRAALESLLIQLAGQADFFQSVYILDSAARIRDLVVGGVAEYRLQEWRGNDLSGLALLRGPQMPMAPVWSDQYRSPVLGVPVVAFVVPLSDGFLMVELAVNRLADVVRQSAVLDGLLVIVTDSKGEVVAAPDMTWASLRQNIADWPVVRQALAAQPVYDELTVNGSRYVGTAKQLDRLGWVVVAGYPKAVVTDAGRAAIGITVVTLMVSVVFGLLLFFGFASLIKQRLDRSMAYARALAQGAHEAPLAQTGIEELDALSRGLQQMAQTVKRREAQLRAIIDTTPSLAIQWFDRDGRVVDWNPASEAVLGWRRDEAIGKTMDQLIYTPQQAAEFVEVIRDIERTGQPFGPYEGAVLWRLERPVWLLSTTFAIPDVDGGQLFVCMDVDITDIKRKEAAVRESEEKFNLFFQASPVAVAVMQECGDAFVYADVNPAWLELLGYQREELIGHEASLDDAILDRDVLQEVFTRLRRDGALVGEPGRLRRRSGDVLLVDVYMRLVDFQDRKLVICSMLDITDKKAMERELRDLNAELEKRIAVRTRRLSEAIERLQSAQAQLVQSEKLASLGSLVAGVAHELNTPIGNGLMSVSTLAQRLREFQNRVDAGLRRADLDQFVAQVHTATDIATRNLRRASELVSSFKQVAVDQTSSQRRPFSLSEVLHEIVLTLQPTFKHSQVSVSLDVPVDVAMNSYPGPLGQVLTNLIQNAAIHAFPDGSPGQIQVIVRAAGDADVEVRVRDNGVGIAEHQLDKVFDPFFTTRLGKGGSGLGLHIAHNIVTGVLGGRLTVANLATGGAEFTITCPVQAPIKSQATHEN